MSRKIEMPRAFIIMPFDDEFNSIYTKFIRDTMKGAGFDVQRSDDIQNQRNILQDIIESIISSDLIIADLTGGNENVFYELGIAHALKRPVILITQELEDIPFDLQSYRVIRYSTHFNEIDNAIKQLQEYASNFLKGETYFGNPFSDFQIHQQNMQEETTEPGYTPKEVVEKKGAEIVEERDDRGFLDHVADLDEGFTTLSELIENVSDGMNRMNSSMNEKSSKLESAESPAHARNISRSIAKEIEDFAESLAVTNLKYNEIALRTENSMEFVVQFFGVLAQDDPMKAREMVVTQIEPLNEMLEAATSGRKAFSQLANTMETIPKIERHLNRAIIKSVKQVKQLADNIDVTIASTSRAIDVGERILKELGSE